MLLLLGLYMLYFSARHQTPTHRIVAETMRIEIGIRIALREAVAALPEIDIAVRIGDRQSMVAHAVAQIVRTAPLEDIVTCRMCR